MKYSRFFKRIVDDSLRDFSGLGNLVILAAIFALVTKKLWTAILGLVIIEIICSAIKVVSPRKRPNHIPYDNFLEKIQSGSFPSVHSALIMYSGLIVISSAASVFAKVLFALYIPIVGYSRYYLKKHFVKDILFGYTIGLLVYFLVL